MWSSNHIAWVVEDTTLEGQGAPFSGLRPMRVASRWCTLQAKCRLRTWPVARLMDLRKLWGMCSAEDFQADEEEVIVRSLRGGDYYDLLRMMAWMMMVSRIPGAKATGIYQGREGPNDPRGQMSIGGRIWRYFISNGGGGVLMHNRPPSVQRFERWKVVGCDL